MAETNVKEFWKNQERQIQEKEQNKRTKTNTDSTSHWENQGYSLWQKSGNTNYEIGTPAKRRSRRRKVSQTYQTPDLRQLYKTPRSKITTPYVTPNLRPLFDDKTPKQFPTPDLRGLFSPKLSPSAANKDFEDLIAQWKDREQRKSGRKSLKNRVNQVSHWEKEGHEKYKKLHGTGSKTVPKMNQRNKKLSKMRSKTDVKKQIAEWEEMAHPLHKKLSNTGTKTVPKTWPRRLQKRSLQKHESTGRRGVQTNSRNAWQPLIAGKPERLPSPPSSESSPEPEPPILSMYPRKKSQH